MTARDVGDGGGVEPPRKRVWVVRPEVSRQGVDAKASRRGQTPASGQPAVGGVYQTAAPIPLPASSSSPVPTAPLREGFVSRTLTFIQTHVGGANGAEDRHADDGVPGGGDTLPGQVPIARPMPQPPTVRTQIFGSDAPGDASASPPDARESQPTRQMVPVLVGPAVQPWRLLHQEPGPMDGPDRGQLPPQRRAQAAEVEAVQLEARGKLHPSLVVATQPASAQAASFRVMRHRLAERGSPRVVLITSAEESEGKSVAAANLALALAEGGRSRVLLVDAHARHPSQAGLFGVEAPESFFAQLARHGTRGRGPWVIGELDVPGVHLLACNAPDDAPFDGRAFRAAMESLRETYDHVIIDAPAVLTSADVSLIEDAVDGVIFVARGRRARGRLLRRAMDQIAPARMLGTMLLEG